VILDKSTYIPVNETDDAYWILFNFEIQQNVKAVAKEEGGLLGVFAIGDILRDQL
jgi:hypothetical protein